MKSENLIATETFAFSIKILTVCSPARMSGDPVPFRQLVRSGTSIGANVEEAIGGQSLPDFLSKMSIAYKEARETAYWLKLLRATDRLGSSECDPLLSDVERIHRIIGAIQLSAKRRLPRRNRNPDHDHP